MSKDYYRHIAKKYDQKWQKYTERTFREAIQLLPPDLSGLSLLDFGCGTGELIKKVILKHPEIKNFTGYDPSREMLNMASIKIAELSERLRDKINIQDHANFSQKFDLIISTNTFHYFKNPFQQLNTFMSLLRKEGILILMDYTKESFVVRYFECLIRLNDKAHHKAYYPDEIQRVVNETGFNVEEDYTFTISALWKGYILKATLE